MTYPLTSAQRRAFLSAPDPQRYYAASSIEEARQRIVRSIARSEGPAMVVGAAGTGKSLLLAVLAEQFEPRMSVVTLPGAQLCTRRALLQMILSELRLPYRHMDEGELRLSILEHLRGPAASAPRLAECGEANAGGPAAGRRGESPAADRSRRMLALVDEADALPTRLLEELRVLTNVVAHGVPLVSLVLAGNPTLEERFADPQLDMFSQRLSCRCYLAPLTREETFQFVRSQVSAVGVKPEKWFDPEALAAIHGATSGVPRLVNQLGDQLVWLIEETGCQPLDAALVQQAWSDLQQLPAPWNTDAHSSLSSSPSTSVGALDTSVVEFGELDAGDSTTLDSGVASRGNEMFVGHEYPPKPRSRVVDDDLPASIPISRVRSVHNADLGDYAAAIKVTEDLVEQLDEFEMLELAMDPPPPEPAAEPTSPAAENPFAEPFDDEEILIDPYSEFEVEALRSARRVVNRIDRTFAAELARCELRKSRPPAAVLQPRPAETSAAAAGDERSPAAPVGSAATATIVPGRQLRRLFSSLEAAGSRAVGG